MTPADMTQQLSTLGVRRGGVLVVHTSFRALRPIDGGPAGFIDALRQAVGDEGTLVMPTMTAGDAPYDAATTQTLDMGVVAETFWRRRTALRSPHPGASFAAEGPRAEEVCADHPLEPPHGLNSPIGRVYTADGQILLVGVHHSENTTLHLAEALAEVPYSVSHPCVVVEDGMPVTRLIAETDHCCEGFRLMDEWLRKQRAQAEGRIGNAWCRLASAVSVVEVALRHLRDDPLVFLCPPNADCDECRAAHASIASGCHAQLAKGIIDGSE